MDDLAAGSEKNLPRPRPCWLRCTSREKLPPVAGFVGKPGRFPAIPASNQKAVDILA
jgi:hypothetical protein